MQKQKIAEKGILFLFFFLLREREREGGRCIKLKRVFEREAFEKEKENRKIFTGLSVGNWVSFILSTRCSRKLRFLARERESRNR